MPFYPVNEKKHRLLSLLEEGLVSLHIDATQEEVLVPVDFKENQQLVLNLSYQFRLEDLAITDERVCATLSFAGSPFRCEIPMVAIWGLSQPRKEEPLSLFAESLPAELLLQFLPHLPEEIYPQVQKILAEAGLQEWASLLLTPEEEHAEPPEAQKEPAPPPQRGLRLVHDAGAKKTGNSSPRKAPRPSLRLVSSESEKETGE